MRRNNNTMVGRSNLAGHRMAGGRFMSGIEHVGTGGAYRGMSPDTFVNGRIASVHYPTPVGPRNMPRSPLSQHFAEGGEVAQNQPATVTNIPEGGYAQDNIGLYSNPFRASVYGGPLSYNQGVGQQQVSDYHTLADSRKNLRQSLVGTSDQNRAVLAAADALQRQLNDNPLGYNDRQTEALELAWQSSPDKVALDAENVQRAKEGKSPIQSDYGLNRYHVREDGSRDYNYSSDGQYRGDIPDEFRNAPGNPNTHDAHFNRETGKWEAGDLSLTQTFKDIGGGLYDAYGNIKTTIPLIGQEVISGVKDLAGKITGTNASAKAEESAATSAALQRANDLANLQAQAAVVAAQDNRDRQSAGSASLAAATRAQLGKTNAFSAANKSKSSQYSGGAGYYMMGGPVSGHYQGGSYVRPMQDGGAMSIMSDMPPEIQEVAVAFQNGELTNNEALQIFSEYGMDEDQLLQASELLDQLSSSELTLPMADGGFVAETDADNEEDEKRRRERAAVAARNLGSSGGQSAVGQFGSQVKNQLISTAASMATKALFGLQDGGLVPNAPQENPLQEIATALKSGQISPEKAMQAMKQIGIPPQQIKQIMSSVSTPKLGPLAPAKSKSPDQALADQVAMRLKEQSGGPTLPTEQFKHGGSVGKDMMVMPTAGPLSSIKTKSVNGYNTEEMSMSFDGKASMPQARV